MRRFELFRFIAFQLEKIGEPKSDSGGDTIYGISKRWHPQEYEEMQTAVEMDNPVILQETINSIYGEMYKNSFAFKFSDFYPLNFQVFDTLFNAGEHASIYIWQATYNEIVNPAYSIKVDGVYGNETANSIKFLESKTKEDYKNYTNYYALKRIEYYEKHSPEKWFKGLTNRIIKLQKWILKREV